MPSASILIEAEGLVNGERNKDYGDAADNFGRWADLCRAYGLKVNAKDLAMIMVLGKLAREIHKHKRDNIVDAAGYLEVYNKLG